MKNRKIGWKGAALLLGETLATVGPIGYYKFSPKQWLAWADKTIKAAIAAASEKKGDKS